MNLPLDQTTASPSETVKLAAMFAESLVSGDVVWLEGDLGAGKTVFARSCLNHLGVSGAVTSPTFTIARRYSGDDGLLISHLDLYRLSDGLAGEDPGVFEPEYGPDRLTFVEWPLRGRGVLPDPDYRVELEHAGGDLRRVRIEQCR